MNKEGLKPCPFCGGDEILMLESDRSDYVPFCSHCGAEIDGCKYGDEAIAAWNRRADGWISVEDRLPSEEEVLEDQEFIVVIKGYRLATTLYFVGGEWRDDAGDGDFYHVTHWMPLPKVPKEVREDE